MHIRIGTALGLPVVDDAEELLGVLSGVFIHPDTGVVEGLFVHIDGFFSSEVLFLASSAIEHWGSRIRVRSRDSLSPLEDFVRLSRLQEEGRTVLGQQMITDSGRWLGRCGDIQFDTRLMRVEWLFPRRWFRWGIPVPINAVVEVKPEAVIVRGEVKAKASEAAEAAMTAIESLASTPAARVTDR